MICQTYKSLSLLALVATTTVTSSGLFITESSQSNRSAFAAEINYRFPGRAKDLKSNEYWYRRKEIHGTGDQKYGYDLTAVRFDRKLKKWTTYKAGTSGAKNEDWLTYGKPVYSVSTGKVIRCWRNAPENPAPGKRHEGRTKSPKTIAGGGNFLIVDIGNNELILYAHLIPGTIPKSLCPIDKEFMKDASDKSESTLPSHLQRTIRPGTYLGKIGNSGRSGNPHLHIHRTNTSRQALMLPFQKVWTKSITKLANLDTDWKSLVNQQLPPGKIAILPPFSPEYKEIARHGIPANKYQFVFDHITGSGYQLKWLDGYQVNGKVYYNAVFQPNTGQKWASFHGLTATQYQQKFDQYTQLGFRPTQVESYLSGNSIRYAVIFTKVVGPGYFAYHGRSADEHQELFNQRTKAGFRPINISVVSVNGKRSYTALYEKRSIGSYMAKSFLTPSQYQQLFTQNRMNGRQLAYLNAYQHNGQTRFTAIWNSATKGKFSAKHGLSSSQYQSHWNTNTKSGLLTRVVTGYSSGNSSRYAALWRK